MCFKRCVYLCCAVLIWRVICLFLCLFLFLYFYFYVSKLRNLYITELLRNGPHGPLFKIFSRYYLDKVFHVFVKHLVCQMISHHRCTVKVEVGRCQLVVVGERVLLIPVECILQVFPSNLTLANSEFPFSIWHTFLDIVPELLYIMLEIDQKKMIMWDIFHATSFCLRDSASD